MLRIVLVGHSASRVNRRLLHRRLRPLLVSITRVSLLRITGIAWTGDHLCLQILNFILKRHDL